MSDDICRYSIQSSAKSLVLELMLSMKIENRTGPRTDSEALRSQREYSPTTTPILEPAVFWNSGPMRSTDMYLESHSGEPSTVSVDGVCDQMLYYIKIPNDHECLDFLA